MKNAWGVIFAFGIVMLIAAMQLSRFIGNYSDWRIAGIICAVCGGAGMLIKAYKNK